MEWNITQSWKEQNNAICSNMDGPRDCHTKWSKSDTERQISCQFSSVQSLSHVQFFATPWTTAHQASLSITNSQSLPKLMSIESVMPSIHLILCHLLLLLPSFFLSIKVFSNESALRIRWPKYGSFNFSINHSNEYSWLISFRIDWFDLQVLLLIYDFYKKSCCGHYRLCHLVHICVYLLGIMISETKTDEL